MFHLSCLRAWLQQSGSDNFTCPICRLPLFLADAKAAQYAANNRGLFGGIPLNRGGGAQSPGNTDDNESLQAAIDDLNAAIAHGLNGPQPGFLAGLLRGAGLGGNTSLGGGTDSNVSGHPAASDAFTSDDPLGDDFSSGRHQQNTLCMGALTTHTTINDSGLLAGVLVVLRVSVVGLQMQGIRHFLSSAVKAAKYY